MQIIFCDADLRLREFFKGAKLPRGAKPLFCPESVQDLSSAEVKAARLAEVMSIFVYSRATAEALARFPKLKFITTRATGYNNIDLAYCKKRGIAVANVANYGATAVAEYAFGLLLDLARKISFSNFKLRQGRVDVAEDTGVDVAGKTVGVIGTGAIGSRFAKLARAFGCDVIAYDLYKNKELEADGTLKYVEPDTLYRKSDFISLHCNETPKNRRMLDAKAFSKMKRGVYIINTARGGLIDTVALYGAVMEGRVAGAGLDVLDHENILIKNDIDLAVKKSEETLKYSLVNKMLAHLPNIVITPHIAYNSREAEERILEVTLANIKAFASGGEVRNLAA